MQIGFAIALSVILGLIFLFIMIGLTFKTVRNRMNKIIQHRFHDQTIVGSTTRANFFGILPKGGKQIRGNGALVLTDDALFFIRALPYKEYIIPLNAIKKISLPRSFNGKSVFSRLLCIDFITGSESDAMAWAVVHPEKWKDAIENMVSKSTALSGKDTYL